MANENRSPLDQTWQYQQTLDSIEDLVLVKGPGSRIIWANRAFREFYGMSMEALKDMIDSPINEPDYTQQYILDDQKVFESGKPLNIPSEPVRRFDGEIRYFNTVKTPIFGEDGKVQMTVGVSRDITEKNKIETALAGQKEKMVLASKMSALGEMASGVAHEVNNPLAVIQTIASQLSEMLAEGELNREVIISFVAEIEQTSGRIAKIINSLRGFSRDDSSDPMVEVTMRSIIDQTLSLCGERFKNHETKVEVSVSSNSYFVRCHPSQISQVLLNLLNNAHDAIDSLPEKWIKIDVTEKEKFYDFAVEDSGSGIPQAIVEKMMNPFFTTKEVGKGTGLGLSISRGIMESHGGNLLYDSSRPRTRFILRIPKPVKNAVSLQTSQIA